MDLLKLLNELREKRKSMSEQINAALTNEALDGIELELRKLDMQIANILRQMGEGGNEAGSSADPAARDDGEEGENPEQRDFKPLVSYRNSSKGNEGVEDIYATLEYRNAFKDYMVSGTPIPEKFSQGENRASELTVVGDAAAVIPTTIVNKVIEDITSAGKIVSRITQTSYRGGIQIPISEINPEAVWLESENVVSDEQKAKMEAKITFSYHVLEARIAIGLLTATVSLPVFEATVVKNLKKAMLRALDKAVISGTGSGQPLGVTKYDIPEKQVITFTEKEVDSVKGWSRAEAALPEEYEEGEIYLMNKATWESHLNSMVDTTGQKIGLGRINEKGQKILNGREVLTTDQLPSYDSVEAGGLFGLLINLEEYCLNSNLAMYYKKYFDEDKNKWIHKALMIADGKMPVGEDTKKNLVGAKGMVYLKKVGADAAKE